MPAPCRVGRPGVSGRGGQPNPPLPWAVPRSSRARPWHRGGGSAWCTPRAALPDSPSRSSRKRSGLAGGTEVAHAVLGAAPATRKAVVSDGVSNRMRGRVGDRSRAAVGRGAAPRLLSAAPGMAAQREAGSTAPNVALALAKLGELVGSVQQREPNGGHGQTRERLPFCSQNANRDENAMAMSHGAAALAGERGRGKTGRGWHAEPWHSVQACALLRRPWEPGTLRNGSLSSPGPARRTNRQCLWEGLWGQAGGQAETQQNSLGKKSPFSQATRPCSCFPPVRASPLR